MLMKKLILVILVIIPFINYAQNACETFGAGCCCPKPYELELDKDTTYSFVLNKTYCESDFYGHPTIASVSLDKSYLGLYVGHQFSVNCCTNETYYIKIKNDTVRISVSSQGDICTCGSCTFEVRFNDENPEKNEYHIMIENVLDTTVGVKAGISTLKNADKKIKYFKTNNQIRIAYDDYFNKYFEARLYNSNGENIYSNKLYNKDFFIDIPKNKGIYILKIWNGIKAEAIKIPIF